VEAESHTDTGHLTETENLENPRGERCHFKNALYFLPELHNLCECWNADALFRRIRWISRPILSKRNMAVGNTTLSNDITFCLWRGFQEVILRFQVSWKSVEINLKGVEDAHGKIRHPQLAGWSLIQQLVLGPTVQAVKYCYVIMQHEW